MLLWVDYYMWVTSHFTIQFLVFFLSPHQKQLKLHSLAGAPFRTLADCLMMPVSLVPGLLGPWSPGLFAFHVVGAICHRSPAIYRSRLLRIMATSTRVTLSCSINKRGVPPIHSHSIPSQTSTFTFISSSSWSQMQMQFWVSLCGQPELHLDWKGASPRQTCSALILGKFSARPWLSFIYDGFNSFPWAVLL